MSVSSWRNSECAAFVDIDVVVLMVVLKAFCCSKAFLSEEGETKVESSWHCTKVIEHT